MKHVASAAVVLARLLVATAALASVAACRNAVDTLGGTAADNTTVFVAEGDNLLEQLDEIDGKKLGPVIEAPVPFSRIGLRFDAYGPVDVEARISTDGAQSFSEWRTAELTFAEAPANNALVDVGDLGDDATHLQLRFAAPVESRLSFLAVDAFELDDSIDDAQLTDGPEEQALVADNGVVSRAQWGARQRNCNSAMTPKKATIHHTETPMSDPMTVPARLRQIQSYHIDVRGWCDIGYHFMVGSDGRVYQGRRENTLGAHAAGANTNNVGIAFVGTFMSSAPNETMMAPTRTLLRALGDTYGFAIDAAHVKGHRDYGDTDCPGNALYNVLSSLFSTPPPPPPPDDEPVDGNDACAQVQVTAATTLNVRPTPGTSGAPVGTLSNGELADVVSVEENGQTVNGVSRWFEIDKGSLHGFVSGAYTTCVAADDEPPVTPSGVYGGLDKGGAKIPRAGLANDTLAGALGVSTEPYGTVVTHGGNSYVRGRCSHFGGPNDTGVTSTETGAVSGERLRSLNSPLNASTSTIASRPADFYYIAMRWDYTPVGVSFWRNTRLLIVNPANGAQVVVRPVDWGPNTSTARVLDLSPQAMKDLGADTDDELLVSFAAEGASLGVH